MSTYSDKIEKHYILEEFENKLKRKSNSRSFKFLRTEDDKRTRREIANNNERRRMQSINAGFESLRKLLPFCSEKEKLSKATILQSTAQYITDLRMKINALENDVIKLTNSENDEIKTKFLSIESSFTEESSKNSSDMDIKIQSNSTSDLGSSLSFMADNLSTELDNMNSDDQLAPLINDAMGFSQQNNLEQLLAAVEQVERLEAIQTIKEEFINPLSSKSEIILNIPPYSPLVNSTNFMVMKPTISPFAEKIIQDAVKLQAPYNKLSSSLASNSFMSSLDCSALMSTSTEIP